MRRVQTLPPDRRRYPRRCADGDGGGGRGGGREAEGDTRLADTGDRAGDGAEAVRGPQPRRDHRPRRRDERGGAERFSEDTGGPAATGRVRPGDRGRLAPPAHDPLPLPAAGAAAAVRGGCRGRSAGERRGGGGGQAAGPAFAGGGGAGGGGGGGDRAAR